MQIDKIAKKIANFINNSKGAQKALRGISNNPALGGAASSFIIATTARPATIMAITPDRDDAKYGACSSVSAGITEIISSYLLYKPMNKAIENSSKQLYNKEGTMFHKNPLLLRDYKSVTNRYAKLLGPAFIVAMIRFSLLVPISKLLGKFGIVKSSNRDEDDKKKLDVKA